ncbi:BLUF domain-containing protein [Pseudoalteromonas holothuriae]|uniref:BLUF domain-containing protein n=1 Tax=Pseudoalteromonas holothuriae TaxID=2963714 RepID=UPI0021BE72B5|nr:MULTISPECIES: BLUF domain-containing protein [unclassified Pseudoalteromonas]
MIELVYVSRAKWHFSEPELFGLLEQARGNNASMGVTGLLLYDNKGTFIQALEGEEKQVDILYNKILADERHSRINRISRKNIKLRAFPDWQMGFKMVDYQSIQTLPSFSQCMQQPNPIIGFNDESSFAVDLLNYFKLSEHQYLVKGS